MQGMYLVTTHQIGISLVPFSTTFQCQEKVVRFVHSSQFETSVRHWMVSIWILYAVPPGKISRQTEKDTSRVNHKKLLDQK